MRVSRALFMISFIFGAVFFLAGCAGKEEKELPQVSLSLWGSEQSVPLLEEAMRQFASEHEKEAVITYTISIEGENSCKATVLSDIDGAADIFCFADDQLDDLWKAGALLPVGGDADALLESVGGADSAAARAVVRDGKVYAIPLSAGNGYFLYYNKAFLSEEDIRTMDGLLAEAGRAGKQVTMDFGSGWYLYSFFRGAGLTLEQNEQGTANICNWNAVDTKYKGTDVCEAMLDIAENPAFVNLGDEGFVAEVEDGSVIAGVNGAWNAEKVAAAWGEDYAAAKLPTYTLAGDQVQMCSFIGYKLMGVNSRTKEPEWSMKAAEFLCSRDQQLKRFRQIGDFPADLEAAESELVQSAPAVAALAEQSEFGYAQKVSDHFWNASQMLGVVIAGGNPDGRDLQELLDETVEAITAE
ncbi:MAG: extracellular solute-binding protein [Lachnospiraceae bacterium]|nr:extracellular solute-binding protein [Lachnospiraceae bacterium]